MVLIKPSIVCGMLPKLTMSTFLLILWTTQTGCHLVQGDHKHTHQVSSHWCVTGGGCTLQLQLGKLLDKQRSELRRIEFISRLSAWTTTAARREFPVAINDSAQMTYVSDNTNNFKDIYRVGEVLFIVVDLVDTGKD